MTYLDPSEMMVFENRRRRARDTYQTNLASLERRRGDTLQQEGLDTASLARRFDRMRERLPGSFIRRGVLNSGIFGRGLQQYAEERQGAQANLVAQYQRMLNDLAVQGQQYGTQFTNMLGAVDDEEAVRRAQIAAALRGLL